MKTEKNLTLEQTLEALHEAAEDSKLIDEVLSMSKEELDADLQKAGIDPVALDARMAAREAEIRLAQDGPKPAPLVAPARAFSKWLIALLLAIGTFVGSIATVVIETFTATAPVVGPLIAYSAPPLPPAEQLRNKAFDACGRGHWQQCLDDFDQAKAKDPDGDQQSDVQDARTRARDALHH